MNKVGIALITLAVAGSSLAVQARGVSDGEMEECRSQISQYYGGASDLSYVGKRQFRDGAQVKVAVRSEDPGTGYSKTRLATCWLGADNFQAYADGSEESMVADVDSPVQPAADEVLP